MTCDITRRWFFQILWSPFLEEFVRSEHPKMFEAGSRQPTTVVQPGFRQGSTLGQG